MALANDRWHHRQRDWVLSVLVSHTVTRLLTRSSLYILSVLLQVATLYPVSTPDTYCNRIIVTQYRRPTDKTVYTLSVLVWHCRQLYWVLSVLMSHTVTWLLTSQLVTLSVYSCNTIHCQYSCHILSQDYCHPVSQAYWQNSLYFVSTRVTLSTEVVLSVLVSHTVTWLLTRSRLPCQYSCNTVHCQYSCHKLSQDYCNTVYTLSVLVWQLDRVLSVLVSAVFAVADMSNTRSALVTIMKESLPGGEGKEE